MMFKIICKNKLSKETAMLENNAHLRLSKEEKEVFLKQFRDFKYALKDFKKISLKYVEPVEFPFEVYSMNLREDNKVQENLENKKYFLENSTNMDGDFFVIKKK